MRLRWLVLLPLLVLAPGLAAQPAGAGAAGGMATPPGMNLSALPSIAGPSLTLSLNGAGGAAAESGNGAVAMGLQILALLTVLTLAPAILIMLTSFTRIVVVLGFVRRALSTQEVPPTQVLIGLSLFLTFFVMAPTWTSVYEGAIRPYFNEEIALAEMIDRAETPTREFLFENTRKNDLALFIRMARIERPQTKADVPTYVLIPSFIVSELQTAFLIGFIIYIPFLIIDMVVSSVLLSMGMMMLPPVIVSLPFKIILFVLVDGWNLIIGSLVRSYF
ncbi:MAG TPA: flagellar type III secretion system pore protein FliP [Candidatus Sumerlaeota bacterium]|nr:MAG: Flagellar biosynthetic protein FliP precursor [candidate division BRC1 bacterium ADurb.BinA292]HOE96546.1 flagellar type III secretion system pore protein FliP [Candidatus Sumerlaeota bacterium]HOR27739.1 flagellar type III secretion system pore protein FliP [Candidatus Sumerlaeota bacterium]